MGFWADGTLRWSSGMCSVPTHVTKRTRVLRGLRATSGCSVLKENMATVTASYRSKDSEDEVRFAAAERVGQRGERGLQQRICPDIDSDFV